MYMFIVFSTKVIYLLDYLGSIVRFDTGPFVVKLYYNITKYSLHISLRSILPSHMHIAVSALDLQHEEML